jgi:hypothetical protein
VYRAELEWKQTRNLLRHKGRPVDLVLLAPGARRCRSNPRPHPSPSPRLQRVARPELPLVAGTRPSGPRVRDRRGRARPGRDLHRAAAPRLRPARVSLRTAAGRPGHRQVDDHVRRFPLLCAHRAPDHWTRYRPTRRRKPGQEGQYPQRQLDPRTGAREGARARPYRAQSLGACRRRQHVLPRIGRRHLRPHRAPPGRLRALSWRRLAAAQHRGRQHVPRPRGGRQGARALRRSHASLPPARGHLGRLDARGDSPARPRDPRRERRWRRGGIPGVRRPGARRLSRRSLERSAGQSRRPRGRRATRRAMRRPGLQSHRSEVRQPRGPPRPGARGQGYHLPAQGAGPRVQRRRQGPVPPKRRE